MPHSALPRSNPSPVISSPRPAARPQQEGGHPGFGGVFSSCGHCLWGWGSELNLSPQRQEAQSKPTASVPAELPPSPQLRQETVIWDSCSSHTLPLRSWPPWVGPRLQASLVGPWSLLCLGPPEMPSPEHGDPHAPQATSPGCPRAVPSSVWGQPLLTSHRPLSSCLHTENPSRSLSRHPSLLHPAPPRSQQNSS